MEITNSTPKNTMYKKCLDNENNISIWSSQSWQTKEKKHIPFYEDQKKLMTIKEELKSYKDLIEEEEINELKKQLKKVYNKEAFFIQIGDCAESFKEIANENNIKQQQKFLISISMLLNNFLHKEIITIGRIAGQFAKPRTSETEKIDGVELPTYKGDIINGYEFTEEARKIKPELMIEAYQHSKNIINLLKNNDINLKLQQDNKSTNLLESYIANDNEIQPSTKIYTSHEALLLDYEECFIKNNFLTSAHTVWLGDRTRFLESAHVEFLKGIENPISIKCGPKTNIEELIEIIKILNPKNEENKITLIMRAGVNKLKAFFPQLIDSIKENDLKVIWCSDPMHGNSKIIDDKKTRDLNDISSEIKEFLSICKEKNIYAGGIHLEATGQNVTECISETCQFENLSQAYKTLCDPRLNFSQTIELLNNVFDNKQLYNI